MSESTPVIFVVWSRRDGRAQELSNALGGQFLAVFPSWLSKKWLTPVRYLFSAVITVLHLSRHRPQTVIVTHPPVVAAAVVAAWAVVTKTPFALDSHPTAFGAKNNRQSRLTLPLHRLMAKRAKAVMVASSPWADVVSHWGGNPVVIHESPLDWPEELALSALSSPPVVFYSGVLSSSDEPIDEVLQAAAASPQWQWRIAGDDTNLGHGGRQKLPPNVELLGFLDRWAYRQAMAEADVVLALTTEPTSVMRVACEATYAQKVLVTSDHPIARNAFPHAVFAVNHADALVEALTKAISSFDQIAALGPQAAATQRQIWAEQLESVRELLQPPS